MLCLQEWWLISKELESKIQSAQVLWLRVVAQCPRLLEMRSKGSASDGIRSTCWLLLSAHPSGVSVEINVGHGWGGFLETHVDTSGPLEKWRYKSLNLIGPPEPPVIFLQFQLKKNWPFFCHFYFFPFLCPPTNHPFLIIFSGLSTKPVEYILNPWVQRKNKKTKKTLQY